MRVKRLIYTDHSDHPPPEQPAPGQRDQIRSAAKGTPGTAAVSSYRVFANGGLGVISGSIPNRQTDTCWLVITQDGRYAYTASFGSGTITSYRFTSTGAVRVIKGKAAFLGVLSQPVDLAFSTGSHYLYLLGFSV